jgi:hypothetical protein
MVTILCWNKDVPAPQQWITECIPPLYFRLDLDSCIIQIRICINTELGTAWIAVGVILPQKIVIAVQKKNTEGLNVFPPLSDG